MLIGNLFHLLIVCFINGERDDLSTTQVLTFGAGTVSLAPQYHDTRYILIMRAAFTGLAEGLEGK